MPTRSEVDEQTREGQRQMLESEDAAIIALLLAASWRRRDNPLSIASRLTESIYSVRRSSRRASSLRISDELSSYGLRIANVPIDRFMFDDLRAATTIANNYSRTWHDAVAGFTADGKLTPKRAGKRAAKKLRSRIVTIAVTENALVFNDQRDRTIVENAPALADYVKVWDASLDKRTCPTCEGLNGTWINAGQSWPGGPPGSAHPRCRCYESIMPRRWAR